MYWLKWNWIRLHLVLIKTNIAVNIDSHYFHNHIKDFLTWRQLEAEFERICFLCFQSQFPSSNQYATPFVSLVDDTESADSCGANFEWAVRLICPIDWDVLKIQMFRRYLLFQRKKIIQQVFTKKWMKKKW